MRRFTMGVAVLCGLMALAIIADLSFASCAANAIAVFMTMTAGIALPLAWARRIPRRALSVLVTVILSGVYLTGLWVLGFGLAFYPWMAPDLEVREEHLICRVVYFGEYAEVRVSKAYPLGIEQLRESYLVDGSPAAISCGRRPPA